MLSDLAAVLHRSRATLAEDALGVVALFALLIGGLSLPLL
jgi:hypothetical protein